MYEKLGMYILVVFGAAVLFGLYLIGMTWGWRPAVGLGLALLFWVIFGLFKGMKLERSVQEAGDRAAEAVKNKKVEPSIRLEGLGQWLEERRSDEEDEVRQEEERRQRLMSLWAQVAPAVKEAVELVNGKLAEFSKFYLDPSAPDFFGRDRSGYGFKCAMRGGSFAGYDSLSFAVTEEGLYVAGVVSWGETVCLPIDEATVKMIADFTAAAAKDIIEG